MRATAQTGANGGRPATPLVSRGWVWGSRLDIRSAISGAAIVAAGAALLISTNVAARSPAQPRFELDWRAPVGCLDREAARNAIESALGSKPLSSAQPAVVRVNIVATESGRFAADIWIYDRTGSGERSFEGAGCIDVAQASALIVAFALNADHGKEHAPAAEEPAQEPERAAIKGRNGNGPGLAIGAWMVGDVGSLPEPDAGFALELEARYGRLSVAMLGSAWLPRTAYRGPVAGTGGEFALYAGALHGCVDILPVEARALELGPCAGAELGLIAGSGVGPIARHTERVFWGAGLFGISLRYLGAAPLALGLRAEVGVPLYLPDWQIANIGKVFEPSAVVGRTSLGVSWQFP